MLFLILSILCSVTVGVLFKTTRGTNNNNTQIITSNYLFALFFCSLFFRPEIKVVGIAAPWGIYVVLGFLLPTIFLLLATSIKHMGIVKTDAAQRLSLFIPLLAAWLLFREEFNVLKISAFIIAIPALLLLLAKPSNNTENKWGYPAAVLIGFGVIDILFKQIAASTEIPFTTSLFLIFGIAFLLTMAVVVYEVLFKKVKINLRNLILGGLVGIFNFGNIFFYLKAHQAFANNPSTVFAGMNLGVILIGSLVGLFIFKEKLTKKNFVGLFLTLVAVVLIVISQSSV
jgi:drug/metabolite transporter (DMT)-like permease